MSEGWGMRSGQMETGKDMKEEATTVTKQHHKLSHTLNYQCHALTALSTEPVRIISESVLAFLHQDKLQMPSS